MQIIPVTDKITAKEFLKVPLMIYKNDPNWIRPLDEDIEKVFDPKKNKFFRHGEVIRWILKEDDILLGRVSAFINTKTSNSFEQPTGGMGFFECVNDITAAFLLFDTCKFWLMERKIQAMDGPVNFGEKDRWWGLLVDGFTEPTYCVNYNPSYYKHLFESYGFKTYYEQYTYYREVCAPLSEKYEEKAKRIAADPNFRFEHLQINKLDKYIEDFRNIYNAAWVTHHNFKPMQSVQAQALINSLKPVMDEKIIWFAYYKDQPAGFFIMLPELNQIFKHVNGKLDWLGKLIFLWFKWTKRCKKIFALVFGIIPEHQGKGLEGAMINAVAKKIQPAHRYNDLEITWIGDFNPKMIHLLESIGSRKIKTHITYRKLFDSTAVFRRAPVIGGE